MPQMQNYDCPTCGIVTGFKYYPRCLECGSDNLSETDEPTAEDSSRALAKQDWESRKIPGTNIAPGDKLMTPSGRNTAWEKLMTTAMDEGRMTNLKNSRHHQEPIPKQERHDMSPFVGNSHEAAGNPMLKSLFPTGIDPVKAAMQLSGGGYTTPYGANEKLTSQVKDAKSGHMIDPTRAAFAALKGKGPVSGTVVRTADDAKDAARARSARPE